MRVKRAASNTVRTQVTVEQGKHTHLVAQVRVWPGMR
jgi:hypothetical protein